ncbi:MAG: MarC family NAAT transporter [Akkermansiaceae bacterium]
MDNWINILALTFSTLFPITNPFGNAGIFLSLTADQDQKTKRKQALMGSIYMFLILEVFFLSGSFILNFFGLSLGGIRIAGGLLIAKFGFDQLQPRRETTHSDAEHDEAKDMEDISFSPLAMPLLAGPGAIASVIGVSSLMAPSVTSYVAVTAGIVLTCLICWIILRESELLLGFLGINGANALTKIMGFLLLCIGVQLAIDGIIEVYQSLQR